jgi:hypothetical protein
MDKEWTKSARESDAFQNGLDFFLDYAYTKGKPRGKEISCPCVDCYNRKWFTRDEKKWTWMPRMKVNKKSA